MDDQDEATAAAPLEQCPDCAGQISAQAPFCPHCGAWLGYDKGGMEVVVTGVQIDFWDMVRLFVKAGLAAVPAFIILWFIGFLLGAILSAYMLLIAPRA